LRMGSQRMISAMRCQPAVRGKLEKVTTAFSSFRVRSIIGKPNKVIELVTYLQGKAESSLAR
jgi:hypothetical protein